MRKQKSKRQSTTGKGHLIKWFGLENSEMAKYNTSQIKLNSYIFVTGSINAQG